MSGTGEESKCESETNLVLSSKDEKIVKKNLAYMTAVIWKWFGYFKSDQAQIKVIC